MSDIKHLFMYLWAIYMSFWRNVCLGLFPTFWLDCLFFWYWVVWAVRIFFKLIICQFFPLLLFFSHSEGCLFTLFVVSFAVQKLLSLIRSHLFTFVFISITLGGWVIEGSCFDLCHQVFLCLCFPLRVLVSGLTFRSLIHFEYIFVFGIGKCFNFILLHVAVQFPSTIYWRGCLCSIVYSCFLCQK